MITHPDDFLGFFDSVHRRTVRDISALPTQAAAWVPSAGEGEKGWSIAEIVRHIAQSRVYFANAYRGEGWIYHWPVDIDQGQKGWVPWLEASAAEFRQRIQGTPTEWLKRKIPMIDTDGTLSGWRILMMMLEHEVHHRSQIDTYAGLERWDVPQIFGRTFEEVYSQQGKQREIHSDP